MAFYYGFSPATAGNIATNATPNTATETLFIKPGATRAVLLQALYVQGKAAALTAISGIAFRVKKWTTASTAGTAFTPQPKDVGTQAAVCTAASRPTAGSGGGLVQLVFGCGAAGPGGWVSPNPESMIHQPAAGAASTSVDDASATASLNFEFSGELQEH
jgi:hypothetical protein